MFELSVALKYLVPKRKQLSVTLIAIMSVSVISLVVWLVLVFLSVTEGMEKNWLKKLTDLNAPVKITPTKAYYSSYYYNIDSVSESSDYQYKTIGQKAAALNSDPYDPDSDAEPTEQWDEKDLLSDGSLKDPVKIAYKILDEFSSKKEINAFQDFEMSGGLLKLQLLRSNTPLFSQRSSESINFLSQVSYIASFPSNNPALDSLIIPPSARDISHLMYLSTRELEENRSEGAPKVKSIQSSEFSQKIKAILDNIDIKTVQTAPYWKIPHDFFQEDCNFTGVCYLSGSAAQQVIITTNTSSCHHPHFTTSEGRLTRKNGNLLFINQDRSINISPSTAIVCEDIVQFKVDLDKQSASDCQRGCDLYFKAQAQLQGKTINGRIPWQFLELTECEALCKFSEKPKTSPYWTYSIKDLISNTSKGVLPKNDKNEFPILLPKGFQENGVLIGDRGYISYNASTTSSIQEQRLSVFVAGFYDPGIMSVGNKCILAPNEVTSAINSATTSHFFDKISLAGIQVWLDDLSQAEAVKEKIQNKFKEQGIDRYFSVSSYKHYDFAKDLLLQFQSDKYLFSLIAIIIITVACCNIISLLVIMVNDKKKEIGILLSMGASSKSIAIIFGSCGMIMGSLGCTIGCISAYLTMHNIDVLVNLLSSMQGHQAFSAAFYGSSLPSNLSSSSVYFVMIATPLLALAAGLIPAIKACFVKPARILRSE